MPYIQAYSPTFLLRLARNTLYNVGSVAGSVTASTANDAVIFNALGMVSSSLLCTAMPRFIISVRELYDRDLRGRWQGVDSGLGALSRDVHNEMGITSKIVFMDAAQEETVTQEDAGGLEVIQLEDVRVGMHRV